MLNTRSPYRLRKRESLARLFELNDVSLQKGKRLKEWPFAQLRLRYKLIEPACRCFNLKVTLLDDRLPVFMSRQARQSR